MTKEFREQFENSPEILEVKKELIEQIRKLQPSFDAQEGVFDSQVENVNSGNGKTFLKQFGYYYCGIGELWVWYDREATFKNRLTGEIEKSFDDTLKDSRHIFLQDASIGQLDEIIKVCKL